MNIRPFCREFLQKMHEFFEIYIFSSSSEKYCEAVIEILDPKKEFFDGFLHKEHCIKTEHGLYIKDLSIITNRKIELMTLVDNLSQSFGFQINNGVPIISWEFDKNDMELKFLSDYLIDSLKFSDFRKFNIKRFNLGLISSSKN